ncbi:MAG: hypothetical protein AAF492_27010, partial [Verrucomicrobiota bacterium]
MSGLVLWAAAGRGSEETVPARPPPLLELGPPFLAPSEIPGGIKLPTGAVWQPALMVYGSYESAVLYYEDFEQTFTEWGNRLDLFGNLQLTGTERLHGAPPAVMLARLIARMQEELGLSGSIGLSHNK